MSGLKALQSQNKKVLKWIGFLEMILHFSESELVGVSWSRVLGWLWLQAKFWGAPGLFWRLILPLFAVWFEEGGVWRSWSWYWKSYKKYILYIRGCRDFSKAWMYLKYFLGFETYTTVGWQESQWLFCWVPSSWRSESSKIVSMEGSWDEGKRF